MLRIISVKTPFVLLQLKVAKEKMAMLIGKSDNDDRLINALRLEIEAQKQVQGITH